MLLFARLNPKHGASGVREAPTHSDVKWDFYIFISLRTVWMVFLPRPAKNKLISVVLCKSVAVWKSGNWKILNHRCFPWLKGYMYAHTNTHKHKHSYKSGSQETTMQKSAAKSELQVKRKFVGKHRHQVVKSLAHNSRLHVRILNDNKHSDVIIA